MNRIDRAGGWRAWGPPLLLAALGALYLWEVVSLVGVPVARDMQLFFLPQKHLLWEALRGGEVPLWTPYVGTGAPFLANFQTGVFYPPNWTFALLPFLAGFNLLVALHFIAGAVFAWLLARELGLERIPAFIAAVAWTFGGYFASLLNLMNALQAAAWAPAIAWALLVHLERRSAGSWFALLAVTLLALLAGEPQTFLLAGATATLAVALRLAERPHARRGLPRWTLGVAALGLLAAGLAAVQILPTLEFVAESNRGRQGLPFSEVAGYQLEPIRLLHLLVPPDYRDPQFEFGLRAVIGRTSPWLFSIYLGPVWLLLFWLAWRNPERRREVIAWTAVAGIGVVLGLGAHTPVFGWMYEHVPGVRSFRFAEKYFFLTAFATLPLAGYGAQAALRGRGGRADGPAAVAFLGALLAGRIALARSREALEEYAATHFANRRMLLDFDFVFGVWGENLTKVLVVAAVAVVIVALHRHGRLRTPLFGALLAALLCGDLMIAHRSLNPVVDPSFYERPPLIARDMPLEQVQGPYRYRFTDFGDRAGRLLARTESSLEAQKWLWQQTLAPNVGQLWGVHQTDAWDAIKLRRNEDERTFYRILPDAGRRWRLLRLTSVRYLYSGLPVDVEGEARPLELDPTLPGHLYELEDPLPRAYVVTDSIRVPDEEAAINAVLSPTFDPARTVALVDAAARSGGRPAAGPAAKGPGAAPAAPARPAERARIVFESGDELRVALDDAPDGFLVLTDSHYPGWRALVDGEERPIELANFFFRAVRLRAGDREVVFRYAPASFRRGRVVSLGTLGLVVLVALAMLVARRGSRAS